MTAGCATRTAAFRREYLDREVNRDGRSALAAIGGTATAAESEHARRGRRGGAPGSERLPKARLPVGADLDPVPLQAGVELEPGEPEELGREGLVAVRPLECVQNGRPFAILQGAGPFDAGSGLNSAG
jgi:hypothetical protein